MTRPVFSSLNCEHVEQIGELVARWVPVEVFDDDGRSLGWGLTPEFATREEAELAVRLLGYEVESRP